MTETAERLTDEIRAGEHDADLLDYRDFNSPDQWLPPQLYADAVELPEADWAAVMEAAQERSRRIHGGQA